MSRVFLRRGVTLIELLIAMGLLLTILGMTSALMREYTKIIRFDDRNQVLLEAVQLGLARMSTEVVSATSFTSPDPSSGIPASAGSLQFFRLTPNRPGRFPEPLDPTSLPLTWNPRASADLEQVEYVLVGQQVYRRAGGTDLLLADNIAGLEATFRSSRELELTFSIDDRGRIRRQTAVAQLLLEAQ